MCSQNYQNKIIEVISQCVERVNCQESDKRDCNLKENELLFNIIKAMSYVPTQWAMDAFDIALKVIDNSLSQKSVSIFEKFQKTFFSEAHFKPEPKEKLITYVNYYETSVPCQVELSADWPL